MSSIKNTLKPFVCAAALVLVGLTSAGVVAQESPPQGQVSSATPEGYHQHDGFFFRLAPGASYSSTSGSLGNADFSQDGAAFHRTFYLGWSVSPNIVLHVSSGGPTSAASKVPNLEEGQLKLTFGGFGLGGTYYTDDLYYATFTAGVSGLVVRDRKDNEKKSISSDIGESLELSVGKEWWVSANWALGVALRGRYTRSDFEREVDDVSIAGDVNNLSFGLAFSATYN